MIKILGYYGDTEPTMDVMDGKLVVSAGKCFDAGGDEDTTSSTTSAATPSLKKKSDKEKDRIGRKSSKRK